MFYQLFTQLMCEDRSGVFSLFFWPNKINTPAFLLHVRPIVDPLNADVVLSFHGISFVLLQINGLEFNGRCFHCDEYVKTTTISFIFRSQKCHTKLFYFNHCVVIIITLLQYMRIQSHHRRKEEQRHFGIGCVTYFVKWNMQSNEVVLLNGNAIPSFFHFGSLAILKRLSPLSQDSVFAWNLSATFNFKMCILIGMCVQGRGEKYFVYIPFGCYFKKVVVLSVLLCILSFSLGSEYR